jgi:O-antigen/teichoic acid export membrane protein
MHELWLKVARTGGARAYSVLIAFVILVVTARWLGPEGRGKLAAILTWVGLFGTLGSMSLGQVAVHRASQSRDEPWLGDILGALMFMTVAISVIGWIVAAALYAGTRGSIYGDISPALLACGFLMLPFLIWEQYGSSLLTAVDRLDIYNNRQWVGRSIGLIIILVMPALHWGLGGALAGMVVAQAIVGSSGVAYLIRKADGGMRLKMATVRDLMSGGLQLHLNAIGVYLVMSTDVLIINYYRGAAETGYYQFAFQLVNSMLIVPQAASMVVFGIIAQRGADAAWEQQRRIVGRIVAGVALLAIVAAIVAPTLISLVVGNAFRPAVAPFRWLLLAVIGMTFATLMAPQWIGRGLFVQASLITIALGIMNFVISWIWVPTYGMYASIVGTLITYAVASVVNIMMMVYCDRVGAAIRLAAPGADLRAHP